MLTRPAPIRPLEPARLAVRRSLLRHHIRSVVSGRTERLNIDLNDRDFDPTPMLVEFGSACDRDQAAYAQLWSAVTHPTFANSVVDNLGSREPALQARSARIAAAFHMEQAVPWIAPLLWSKELTVRSAAARALGRIGGVRSASALLMAIQQLGPRPVLIIALARAAPDLYLESILSLRQPRAAQPAVAIAAGLRRRRAAVAPIVAQMAAGSSKVRTAGSRALGWLRAADAIPALVECLGHRDWRVRMSAAKALGGISGFQPGSQLMACLVDRHSRVRAAADLALRRRGGRAHAVGKWA